MRTISKAMFLLMALSLAFVSCKKGTKSNAKEAVGTAAKAEVTAKSYAVNSGQVSWTGSKVGGKHLGTFNITNGKISMAGDELQAGTFNIDMASLAVTDLKPGEGKEDLEGHLKSKDFFNVAVNPTGMFAVTKAVKSTKPDVTHVVSGDLTLNGVTKNITFDANIQVLGDMVSAVTPNFNINRTDFGIKYGSGNFFDLAKDKVISDEVGIRINFEAK